MRDGKFSICRAENIEEQISALKSVAPLVDIRTSNEHLSMKLTILISDRKEFMSWELKDDSSKDPYEAGGVATHSNYPSLAESYAIIFDNLWRSIDLAQGLKDANANLASKEKAMQEFIDIAAHELRTPIQPILGLSEFLSEQLAESTERVLLDVIIRNARRLKQLGEDILDVTRIESGLLKLEITTVSLDEVVTQSIAEFQVQAKASAAPANLSFSHEADADRETLVSVDKNRISQVISNLLENALKFTNGGMIQVLAKLENNDGFVTVSISDQGPGIDDEILPKLFTKFTSKSQKGTGLGLYICKSIVLAHGGRSWAQNNHESSGATFSFTLPVQRNPSQPRNGLGQNSPE